MKVLILTVVAATLMTGAASAQAGVIYVPGDYSTIQAAINAAGNSDIVLVAPATYAEKISFLGKNITVASTDPEDPCVVAATVIDGGGSGSVVTFDDGETAQAVLTGFTITGGTGTYAGRDAGMDLWWGGGICCVGSSPTIVGNVITGNDGPVELSGATPKISYGGGIVCIEGLPNISRNIIKNNSAYIGGGVTVVYGNARVISNLIYENSAVAGGGAVVAFGGELVGNTIVANEAEQAGNVFSVADSAMGSGLVSSNIICNATNGGGIYAEPETPDTTRYNNVFNNSGGDYPYTGGLTGVGGNISTDPCFVDAAAYDFHLQPASACISAGEPDIEVGIDAKDIDGQNRIFALRIDIGADEYVGYVPPVANAGPDQRLEGIQLVTLDGSGSFFYDSNGTKEFYWEQTSGVPVTLSDPCAVQPTFMPEAEGQYKFELSVSDGLNSSEADEVVVVVGEFVLLAFPGAEGSGRFATGGRGGEVYEVTNLNDSGPGSIVDALSRGNRIVVFRLSGTIVLDEDTMLRPKSNTTIAGQTAPGDGICIAGRFHITNNVHDVVIRYIRVRVNAGAPNADGDGIDIHFGSNIIIDHVTVSYARDEGISCREDSNNVTVQWCIISEGLRGNLSHSYGSLVRGEYGQKKTYHHNLYAHNNGRNPRPGNYTHASFDPQGLYFDFRNNVIYNWLGNTAGYNDDNTSVSRYNFVGNVYITGPESYMTGRGFRERTKVAYGYFADNSYNGVVPVDPWSIVEFGAMSDDDIVAYKARSYLLPMEPVTTTSPAQAKIDVLAGAGASFPTRDIIDTRIVNDVLNGTGHSIYDTDEQPEGGWPTLNSLPAPIDTDHDGMPDYWELALRLDPNDSSDSTHDRNGDGYTNIEEYINWLPLGEPVPPPLNTPPVANAGPNQTAYAGYEWVADVSLDGSGSYDDDNDVLDYYWSWTIDDHDYEANGVAPMIRLPVGEHQIMLVVDDGVELSGPDYCTITVVEPIVGELKIVPRALNAKSKGNWIRAMLAVPVIPGEQINGQERLRLHPGDIEAEHQRFFKRGKRNNLSICAITWFDRQRVIDAIEASGEVQVSIVGKYVSGRFFYGQDVIRVIHKD